MKRFLLIVIPIAIIGFVAAYLIYNKPHKDMESAEVAETISAQALLATYEEDEQAANTQFLDKVIAIEGVVREKRTSDEGSVQLILETGNPLSAVSCSMDHLTEHPGLDAIQKGDRVKVKGICTGMLMDVIIDRCVIIE